MNTHKIFNQNIIVLVLIRFICFPTNIIYLYCLYILAEHLVVFRTGIWFYARNIFSNQFLLDPNAKNIYSESSIGVGKEYVIDFVIQKSNGDYLLVEIESSKHNIFTKNNDFAAILNHAVKQVEDWQEWIEDNISSAQKKYPGIISPEGLVVIGRSIDFSKKQIKSLKRRNINTRGKMKIVTYDDLIIDAKAYVKSISSNLRKSDA